MSDHTERAHALLSASSSAMWIACTPSARLNELEPEDTSEYAEQGTLGHDMVENELLYLLGARTNHEFEALNTAHVLHPLFTQDLDEAVTRCVSWAWPLIEQAEKDDAAALILVEKRIDFSRWVPEGFGTSDLCIVTNTYLHTIDWKFGQGEWVDANENSQLRLYAAGAMDAFGEIFDFDEVRSTVVQPRVGNIATETLTRSDLVTWADSIAPRAALAFNGEGLFNPGPKQCRWCKVRGKCRARTEANLALATREFEPADLLADEELGLLYPMLEEFIEWAKDLIAHTDKRVLKGANVTGLKAVEGKSNRVITDPNAALERLLAKGYTIQELTVDGPRPLLPLTQLERAIGPALFKEILGELLVKPPGKLIVVPSTDKRTALDLSPTTPEDDFT